MHAYDLPFSLYLNDSTKDNQEDNHHVSYAFSTIHIQQTKQGAETSLCRLITCYMALLYRYTGHQELSASITINNKQYVADVPFTKNGSMILSDINAILVNWWKKSLVTIEDNKYSHSKIDFELFVENKTKDQFDYSIMYNKNYFHEGDIERFVNQLTFIVENVLFEDSVSKIQIIDDEEQNFYLNLWNNENKNSVLPHKSIMRLLYGTVKKNPNKIAVIHKDNQLTFNQLLSHVENVACSLKSAGMAKGDNVGVLLEKSHWSVISLLAIIRCGGVYVPLDISYPRDYIEHITDTVKPSCVISQKSLQRQLPDKIPTLVIEGLNESRHTNNPAGLVFPLENCDDLIDSPFCILFTSGSTAKAKGVLHAQRSFIERFYWMWGLLPIQDDDVFLQRTTVNFGPSIWEFLGGLLQGAKTVILSERDAKLPEQILQSVKHHHVTRIGLVPSLLAVLLDTIEKKTCSIELVSALNKVRICSVAGEALSEGLFHRFTKQLPQVELYNDFGSTEMNGIFFCNTRERPKGESRFPIGRPAEHVNIYVLDENGRQVPPGMPGILHVAGETLALGYIDSNVKPFSKNPFSTRDEHIFNTGDHVKFNEQGVLFLLGRNDSMVKIRGMRVNLTQVESAVKALPSVVKCSVQVKNKKNGDNQLIAFIVQTKNKDEVAMLRSLLQKQLPDYMLPASIIDIPELPFLPNGKLDKQSLLGHISLRPLGLKLNKNSDAVEETLLAILYDVIELPQIEYKINPQYSFSELGLDSISAVEYISQVNKYYDISLQTTVMFDYPSFGDFSHFIKYQLTGNDSGMLNHISVENTLLMADRDECYKQIQCLPIVSISNVEDRHIFLTGATGYLGCFLIESLISLTNKKIYCVVRGKDDASARERIIHQLSRYNINCKFAIDRLVVFSGDLASKNMGLSNKNYDLIAADTSHIFHCGAYVDHFCGYGGLRKVNTNGVMEVIRLAAYKRAKNISFTSTVGVTISKGERGKTRYSSDEKSIPEGGNIVSAYGKSKWIGEQLLEEFAKKSNANINIYRIGEVSGHSKTGVCREDDIFHNMIKSFLKTQEYPRIPNAVVDILPVDFVSKAIITLGLNNKGGGFNIYHLSHTAPVPLSYFLELWNERKLKVTHDKSAWLKQCRKLVEVKQNNFLPGLSVFLEEDDKNMARFELYFKPFPLSHTNMNKALTRHQLEMPDLDKHLITNYKHYFNRSGFITDVSPPSRCRQTNPI